MKLRILSLLSMPAGYYTDMLNSRFSKKEDFVFGFPFAGCLFPAVARGAEKAAMLLVSSAEVLKEVFNKVALAAVRQAR